MNFLQIHVPEELEAAVGYKGQARYFAMYWTPAGDEAMIDDGEVSFDGNWYGYLAFIEHPYIRPYLFGAQLGNSDEEALQMLIIDRVPSVARREILASLGLSLPPASKFFHRRQ